ncbi:hypothetical protein ACIBG4_06885 [Nonomuraea sp. NPDC050383]|uniref:hypothetical protein n=1 Tax=Nonomuraea sp. NPDC050383 TaxID=3364362 RepID=UPI0037AB0CD4
MASGRDLYDLLESHWEGLAHNFAAVWSEGLTVEETARRLRVAPETAATVTLAGLPSGFGGDEMPGDHDGIVLVGQFASWSLAIQVQWLDITNDRELSDLSRDGGRAVGIGWHGDGGHRIYHAVDGQVVDNLPMEVIPPSLAAEAEGLEMPATWDVPVDQGSPTEEMITTSLVLIGRVTGQEIDQSWLDTSHTRYLIRRSR